MLSDKASVNLHYFLQMLGDKRLVPYLHLLGKTYLLVARKPGADDIHDYQTQGSTNRGVGSKAMSEHVMTAIQANL